MSGFENTDSKHDFQGAFAEGPSPTDDSLVRRRDAARKKDVRKDRKDKGYVMFEEEDSEEELVADETNKSPTKAKKHAKPTFKFAKKDKAAKPKDKEKDDKKDKKDKVDKDKDKKEKPEKVDKEKIKEKTDKVDKKDKFEKSEKKDKIEKEQKKDDDVKWRTKKKFMPAIKQDEPVCEDIKAVFGVALPVAVERSPCHDGIQLPVVVRECIDYIEEFGLSSEGIYRISGVKSKVQSLKDAYNKGMPVYLHDHEPNDIASLLKQFFRDLPEPLLTAKLMPKFEQASTIKNVKEKVEQFELLLSELPPINRMLLSWMIVHMTHVIAREKHNKMTLQNVSIVLSPTMQISHRVLNIFFGYSKILFKDTVIKRYVPPLKPVSSRWSLELPDSPSAIEEELKKQESLLNHLHEELMKVKDMRKEEQLWEVQRVVTQLKRKLKHAKQVQLSAELAKRREEEIMKEKLEKQQQAADEPARAEQDTVQDSRTTVDEDKSVVEDVKAKPDDKSLDGGLIVDAADQKGQVSEPVQESLSSENAVKGDSEAETKQTTEQDDKDLQIKDSQTPADRQTEAVSSSQDNETAISCVQEEAAKSKTDDTEADKPSEDTEVEDRPAAEAVEPAKIVVAAGGDHAASVIETEKAEHLEDTGEDTLKMPVVEVIGNKQQHGELKQQDIIGEPGAVARSPSEESSDAYTDVLEDEEETDHLSNILETNAKFKQPPDVEYTELCEESSAALEESTEQEEHTTKEEAERELDSILDDSHLEESEHDEHPYSERTTSSEPSEFEDDDEYRALEQENIQLMMEEEELLAIGDELRQKIRTEKREIERLHQDIAELKMIREDMYDSDESSSSSDESDDSEDLREILQQLIRENEELELENADLCDKIHQERQICIAVKVQNRMMQQRNLEMSGYGLDDRESLI